MPDDTVQFEIVERLTRIEESLKFLRLDLVGNGQPGRLNVLETDVRDLRDAHNRQKGVIAAVSAIVAGVVSVAAHFVKRL